MCEEAHGVATELERDRLIGVTESGEDSKINGDWLYIRYHELRGWCGF